MTMTTTLAPYPAYKDSGVPWLGQIPTQWGIAPLKYATCINARVLPENTNLDYEFQYIDISSVETGKLVTKPQKLVFASAPSRARRIVCQGDTLLSTVRTYLKAIYYVSEKANDLIASTGFAVLTPGSSVNPKFVSYYVQSDPFTEQVTAHSVGIAYPAIAETRLGRFGIPLPPLPEQHAIARFLDHIDGRINRTIRAKRKLIALLNEQKQAIIHRAVTRGLDPDVALRPSGVEWLGEIPAHWEVLRIKSLSQVRRGASPRPIADSKYFDENGEYAWVRIADVSASNRYLYKTTQRLSPLGKSLSVPLEPGTLFLSIAGSVGKPIITHIKCCIHDGFVYFPQFQGNTEFLYRVFESGSPFGRLGKLGTQLNLNTDTVANIRVGWPSIEEQVEIVKHIAESTSELDQAIEVANSQIDLIREYRTRLIADVVTGKLDVRAAAAGLPEELAAGEEWAAEESAEWDEAAEPMDAEEILG